MAEPDATAEEDAEAAANPATSEARSAKEWLEEIQQAERDRLKWHNRAKKIEKLYLEERSEALRMKRQYALLWANVSVLQPAVYAQAPKPVVTRRFSDKDPLARAVSEVMERSLTTLFDFGNIDSCLRSVRDDFLVVGQGTAWVRYEPKFSTQTFNIDGKAVEQEVLADERVAFDFVHWSDFVFPKARRWEDLPWAGRRVYMDKKALTNRFGREKAEAVMQAYSAKQGDFSGPAKKPREQACIYEIWSKRDGEILWLAKEYGEEVLDRKPPLYDLQGFFPCPKPAFATLPTDNLEPVPDYVYYQDQADDINKLTARIGALADSLKLVGFYPAGAEGGVSDAIEMALSAGTDNRLIPVPSWSAFAQGGGSAQLVQWLPLEVVLAVLQGCIAERKQLIEDVFQITGLSDIIRGSTDPRETRGAQQIKAQWGSIRIRDRQAELARYARDLTRIAAEIVAEKFQPETLWRLSLMEFPSTEQKQTVQAEMQKRSQMEALLKQRAAQAEQPPQPGMPPQPQQPMPQLPPIPDEILEMMQKPAQEEIIALMRDDRLRSYRIDIETDSTIAADEQAEKQNRQEFVTVLGGMLQQAVPVATQVPELVPVIGQSLLFLVRAYRTGRQLEDVIEQTMDQLAQKAKQSENQPPRPDPKMEKVKADKELGEKELQQEGQIAMTREKREAMVAAGRLQLDREAAQTDAVLEQERIQAQAAERMLKAVQQPQMRPL